MKMNILKKAVMACSVAGLVAVGCVSVAQADQSLLGGESAATGDVYVFECGTGDTVAPDGAGSRAGNPSTSLICYSKDGTMDASDIKYVKATATGTPPPKGQLTITDTFVSGDCPSTKTGAPCVFTRTAIPNYGIFSYDLSKSENLSGGYASCSNGWDNLKDSCTGEGSTAGSVVGCWICK